MKFKINDIMDSIDDESLYKIQKDLESGGAYLKKLVDDKLKEIEKHKKGVCATCGMDLAEKEHTHTLIFGPDDFKKKASFCEVDCLQYFLGGRKNNDDNLKALNEGIENGL